MVVNAISAEESNGKWAPLRNGFYKPVGRVLHCEELTNSFSSAPSSFLNKPDNLNERRRMTQQIIKYALVDNRKIKYKS